MLSFREAYLRPLKAALMRRRVRAALIVAAVLVVGVLGWQPAQHSWTCAFLDRDIDRAYGHQDSYEEEGGAGRLGELDRAFLQERRLRGGPSEIRHRVREKEVGTDASDWLISPLDAAPGPGRHA